MAIKASATITLTTLNDIDSVYWFYKLQASTATPPTKAKMVKPSSKGSVPTDTTGVAGSWTVSEPTYTPGDTKTLYRVELTYYTDGTSEFSEVSVSSSYEAAKQAYNKAQNAETLATNIEVGGRNLIGRFNFESTVNTMTENYYVVNSSGTDQRAWSYESSDFKTDILQAGSYILSYDVSKASSSSQSWLKIYTSDGTEIVSKSAFTEVGTTSTAFTLSSSIEVGVFIKIMTAEIRIKLERGNKATDWTPAPEDVDSDIGQAQADAQAATELATTANNSIQNTQDDLNNFQQEVTSNFNDMGSSIDDIQTGMSDMGDNINGLNTQINSVNDSVSDLSESTSESIGQLQSSIDTQQELIDANAQAIAQYTGFINIDTGSATTPPSITVAADISSYLQLLPAKLSLVVDNNEVAYLSNERLYAPSAVVNNLYMQMIDPDTGESVGSIGWVMRTNAHLSLKRMK